jgi:hypothetical protein
MRRRSDYRSLGRMKAAGVLSSSYTDVLLEPGLPSTVMSPYTSVYASPAFGGDYPDGIANFLAFSTSSSELVGFQMSLDDPMLEPSEVYPQGPK